jgi:hypothetical protein
VNSGKRLTVLRFLTADPRLVWNDFIVGEDNIVAVGGEGTVSLIAPFIPSRMESERLGQYPRQFESQLDITVVITRQAPG